MIQARLAANLGDRAADADSLQASGSTLPDQVAGPFADAMAEALVLPAVVMALGLLVAVLLARPTHAGFGRPAD